MKMNLKRELTIFFLCLVTVISFGGSFPPEQDEIDHQLGPWLDLKGGGIAVGKPQGTIVTAPDGTMTGGYGSLVNASILPSVGEGFESVSDEASSAGAGMMISLIENSAIAFHTLYPEITIRIGDIAQTNGGYFYPPHKSHQNGLDADVLFMGATDYSSVVGENGQVTDDFDKEKNWQYWRMITAQKFMQNGRVDSVVSMILVAPEIKSALCQWAKAQNILENPEDREVMRRLRPTVGHDDHFHIRLRCSPYHTECSGTFSPSQDIGCP